MAGTTNVRIYHQAVASPASVQSKQIGVNTTADATLGFKMWFGKDADGNVTQFLSKDKNSRWLNGWGDTNRFKAIYSARDTGVLSIKDSSLIRGLRTTRFYYGTEVGTSSRNDTVYSQRDTAKIMKADSGDFVALHTGRQTIDTVKAEHLINLAKTGKQGSTSGDIWNDSAETAFENYTNGLRGTFNRCLFAQDYITLDSNSASEVEMFGTDTVHGWLPGADSLPANWFKRSKKLKIIIRGIYSTKATAAGTMTAKLYLNDTVVATTGAVSLTNNQTDETWLCDGAISCRSTGTAGIIYFVSAMQFSTSNTWTQAPFFSLTKTINTTKKQRLHFTVQFGTADVANKVRVIQFELDEIH
jgi:hypothetical protein